VANDIRTVTGVILAGGSSSRMGSNKALLSYHGGRLIESIYGKLASVFAEVIVVTNHPEHYEFLPCTKVRDIFAGRGGLAGLHAGLSHSGSPAIFAVACDMPHLDEGFIRHMAGLADPAGVVIPQGPDGLEPLHAVYGRGCLSAMEHCLANDERKISSFFTRVAVTILDEEDIASFDPQFLSFRNINTPEDYYHLRQNPPREYLPALSNAIGH
jgi:molybdopterin-guanine dinucleotide biosynthesis protein A